MTDQDLVAGCFYEKINPDELVARFGSPLYVYSEDILRNRCREMIHLVDYTRFGVHYSVKANANLALLKIIRQEGLYADAMSPGEILFLEKAGFSNQQIFFIPNNVSADEIRFASNRKILTSFDSLSQLETAGRVACGSRVALRINTGIGAGHHDKVVTGGKKTKFGIHTGQIDEALRIARQYQLRIVALNHHIGSLFMEPSPYLQAAENLLSLAEHFPDLEMVDLGGGFGIPYHKTDGEKRLDLDLLGQGLERVIRDFTRSYGEDIDVRIEPGRYVAAECGIVLGTVHAMKKNGRTLFAGTDIGFNVLMRPVMYDSWHDILVYRNGMQIDSEEKSLVTVVGNICESGDTLAANRPMPPLEVGDVLAVLDAGAYGYAMSSNYNNRFRPAEVLMQSNGSMMLIRRREQIEDLLQGFSTSEGKNTDQACLC